VASLQGGVAYFIMPDHLGAPHEIVNAERGRKPKVKAND
jgi:hypothetical protein